MARAVLDYHLSKTYVPAKSESLPKTRQTKEYRDWEQYLSLKHATQKTCQEAYTNYLIKTLTSDPNGSKRLGALIKSNQHDHLGVAPLKEVNIIYSDPMQKASILNRIFTCLYRWHQDITPRPLTQSISEYGRYNCILQRCG